MDLQENTKYIDSEDDINSLIQTNRQLVKKKKYTNLQKLQGYENKIQKINKLLQTVNQNEAGYLQAKLQTLVKKRNRIKQKMQEIEQIQEKIQKYRQKQNIKKSITTRIQDQFIQNYFKFVDMVFNNSNQTQIQNEKKKIKVKYMNINSSTEIYSELIRDLNNSTINFMKQYQSILHEPKEISFNATADFNQKNKVITAMNSMLKCFDIQFSLKDLIDVNKGLSIFNKEYLKRQTKLQNDLKEKEMAVEIYTKQKQDLLVEIEHIRLQERNSLQQLQNYRKELQKLEAQINKQEYKQISLVKQHKSLEKEFTHMKKQYDSLCENLRNKQIQIKQTEINLKKIKEKEKKYTQKQVDEEIKLKKMETENSKIQSYLKEREHDIQKLKDLTKQLLAEKKSADQEFQFMKKEIEEKNNDINKLTDLKSILQDEINQRQHKNQSLMQNTLKLEQDYKKLIKKIAELEDQQKNMDNKFNQLKVSYENILQSVALLKQEEASSLQKVLELRNQIDQQTIKNDRLTTANRELQKGLNQKYEQMEQLVQELQECKAHKSQMEQQFENIQQQKQVIFRAVLEKEEYCKIVQCKKHNLEQRVNKLENEAHKYQKIFTQYNLRIELLTNKILELTTKQKQIETDLEDFQNEEVELINRIKQLQRLQSKLLLTVGSHQNAGLNAMAKFKIEEILKKMQNINELQKTIQIQKSQNRRLKLQNQNLKNLLK